MPAKRPRTVVATYRVQAGREEEFLAVLRRHYPTLKSLDLVTDEPPAVYLGEEQEGGPIVFEIFTWKDADAPDTAHRLPEVMAVWEPLGALCEERGAKPRFEFPHVEKLDFATSGA